MPSVFFLFTKNLDQQAGLKASCPKPFSLRSVAFSDKVVERLRTVPATHHAKYTKESCLESLSDSESK